MRIAITGHTSGLGQELYNRFQNSGHKCTGFSRQTGHDIETQIFAIVAASMDCDLFVNNAYSGFSQTELLYELWAQWKDLPRTIINVSSRSGDTPAASYNPYKIHKKSLTETCQQLQRTRKNCRVICIKPSLIDTPMTQNVAQKMLTTAEVAQVIEWILQLPAHLLVADISLVYHEQHNNALAV